PLQLRDGTAIELDSDLIEVGDDAVTNPASNQRDDRPAEPPALRGVARLRLSYGSAWVGPGVALVLLFTHCVLLRSFVLVVPVRIDVLAGSLSSVSGSSTSLRSGPGRDPSSPMVPRGRLALSCASIWPTASSGMIHRSLFGSFLAG